MYVTFGAAPNVVSEVAFRNAESPIYSKLGRSPTVTSDRLDRPDAPILRKRGRFATSGMFALSSALAPISSSAGKSRNPVTFGQPPNA